MMTFPPSCAVRVGMLAGHWRALRLNSDGGNWSFVADDQCGDDWIVVAHFHMYHLRLDRAPRRFGTGKDVIDLLAGGFHAEGVIARRAVKPLVHELPNHGVIGRGVEVTCQYNGKRRMGKMVYDELNLGSAAHAVKGLEMCARHRDGIAVGQDKAAFEQPPLLHAGIGVRQLDVVHTGKLMPREQADAVKASTELDGGPEQPLHATIVGQLGDEIAVILMWAIGTPGIVIHLLQRDKVGTVLLDELPYLLQAGIMAGMEVKGHDPDGVVVPLGKGRKGQQPYRNQEYVAKSHDG